jgi:hypothetical protein
MDIFSSLPFPSGTANIPKKVIKKDVFYRAETMTTQEIESAAIDDTDHTIVFLEHDSTIFDDAGQVKTMIPRALKEISHDKIVILYAPKMDRHLSFLISDADRVYVFESSDKILRRSKTSLDRQMTLH